MDDIRAVMDAADSERAVLWAAQEGTRIALLFAATYPERTTALVLYDPTARGLWAPDYPWAPNEDAWRKELREIRDRWGDRDYLVERAHRLSPVGAENESWLAWFVWYMRRSASPAEAVAFHRMSMEGDVREILDAVRAPTLVLHRSEETDEASYVTERIRGARRVEVKGLHDWFSWADPEHNAVLLRETHEFLDNLSTPTPPDRVLATVLFTDIVGSTARAAELGDTAWRELLARHHTVVRGELVRFRGDELDTAGDGFFAAFDGPGRAIECARAIREALRATGHRDSRRTAYRRMRARRRQVGRDRRADRRSNRLARRARRGARLLHGERLVAGSEIEFEERGTHELKGIPGEWRLFAVR